MEAFKMFSAVTRTDVRRSLKTEDGIISPEIFAE